MESQQQQPSVRQPTATSSSSIHINPKFRNAHINPNFIKKSKNTAAIPVAPPPTNNPSNFIHINPKFINAAQSLSIQSTPPMAVHHLPNSGQSTITIDETNVHYIVNSATATTKPYGFQYAPAPTLPAAIVRQQPIISKTNKKIVREPAIIVPRIPPTNKQLRKKLLCEKTKEAKIKLRNMYKIDRRTHPSLPTNRLSRSLSETLGTSQIQLSKNNYKMRRM